MIMVAAMAAALWGIGIAMDAPKRARWIMIGLLLVVGLSLCLLASTLVLPAVLVLLGRAK